MKTRKLSKYNSKTTEINCIRCRKKFYTPRNHSKTCSELCRVQEGIERKEKGYVHFMIGGTQKVLNDFLTKITSGMGFLHFSDDANEIQSTIKSNDNSKTWKLEAKGFRLAFFPNNKKKPFELYFVTSKKKTFDLFHAPIPIFKFSQPQQHKNQ